MKKLLIPLLILTSGCAHHHKRPDRDFSKDCTSREVSCKHHIEAAYYLDYKYPKYAPHQVPLECVKGSRLVQLDPKTKEIRECFDDPKNEKYRRRGIMNVLSPDANASNDQKTNPTEDLQNQLDDQQVQFDTYQAGKGEY